MSDAVRILYRPVGPKELELIAASGYREISDPAGRCAHPHRVLVPAEELGEFNRHIVGLIEVIASFEPAGGT